MNDRCPACDKSTRCGHEWHDRTVHRVKDAEAKRRKRANLRAEIRKLNRHIAILERVQSLTWHQRERARLFEEIARLKSTSPPCACWWCRFKDGIGR